MRGLLLGCVAALTIVPLAAARPLTTNEPAIFTVKVTLTDTSVKLSPDHAARGSTCTFVITNRGRKTHRFVFGAVRIGSQGFARTLKPQQQVSIPIYLDYRGALGYANRTGTRTVARGTFRIT